MYRSHIKVFPLIERLIHWPLNPNEKGISFQRSPRHDPRRDLPRGLNQALVHLDSWGVGPRWSCSLSMRLRPETLPSVKEGGGLQAFFFQAGLPPNLSTSSRREPWAQHWCRTSSWQAIAGRHCLRMELHSLCWVSMFMHGLKS